MRTALTLVCASSVSLTACGSGDDANAQRLQDERVAAARQEGKRQARQDERLRQQSQRQRRLERQLQKLKRQKQSGSSGGGSATQAVTPAVTAASSSKTGSSLRPCDANVQVGNATACPFAENVFYEYYIGGRPVTLVAFDPSTGSRPALSCGTDGGYVTCRGGSDATVRFSVASVDAYTDVAARRYAASHNLG